MLLINSIYLSALRYVSKATRYGLSLMSNKDIAMKLNQAKLNKPSTAYIMATWAALVIGVLSYLIGLWNASFELNEKGYYFAVFLLAMFAAVTLQKSVRDQEEGLPVTKIFFGMCWVAFASAVALLVIGLINADILLSEKGFYGISFLLALFAVITAQKNTRDLTNELGQTDSSAFPKSASKIDAAIKAGELIP
ncbi:inner membrane protein YiaA [Motilimonas eburnea]|uniref:inner membrane protein YiaA n=1 Tax=Motilimonas eburnea TaxID=1737488 RepID=UPI001EE56FE4|nr:inner membrane protein YiaA [Motilimonas eburnea]